ncbi:MAG: VOC family protein [Burkholderiales bacterium]|nr:VOC family protein [Burkholderiales bacterium]
MSAAFTTRGLYPSYGGPHGNGATHMAQLGFGDGSYLEFIAPISPDGPPSPIWNAFMAADAGPCAWCVASDAPIAASVASLRANGVRVTDPVLRSRILPDGVALEWEMALVGEGSPGSVHPFLIRDITARSRRVAISPATIEYGLTGIEAVVIAVRDADATSGELRRAYGLGTPHAISLSGLRTRLLGFRHQPVILAQVADDDALLKRRLRRFGDAPFAVLLASRDLACTCDRLGVTAAPRAILGEESIVAAWLPMGNDHRGRIGIVGQDTIRRSRGAAQQLRDIGAAHVLPARSPGKS